MKNYENLLPKTYKDEDKPVGIAKLVTLDDMMEKNNLRFFISSKDFDLISETNNLTQILEVCDAFMDAAVNDKEIDSLVIAYKKEFKDRLGMFGFSSDENNQYNMMLFKPDQVLLKSLFRGGTDLAKKCPLDNKYVLYLDCLECDKKDECKRGEIKNESSK